MKKDSSLSSKRKTLEKKCFFLLLFTLCALFLHGVEAKSEPTTPSSECDAAKKLVENFLKLDAAIGRLSSEDYKKYFDSMIVYKIGGKVVHEEPGWDTFTVIRSYSVTKCLVDADTFYVAVAYKSLGELSSGGGPKGECSVFKANKDEAEDYTFEVLKMKKGFKIKTTPSPHVSVARALELLKKEKKDCSRESVEAIRQIKAILSP